MNATNELTIKSAEFYEMLEMFERVYPHMRLDREATEFWSKGAVYQSGETNNLFHAFRHGYVFAKAVL